MTISISMLAAVISVLAPNGDVLCRVTPPDPGPAAEVEATNLIGGVAWRIRYDGTAPRNIPNEEWTFDFERDFKCWPVSHAQGEYIPHTLSTIAHKRNPSRSRSGASDSLTASAAANGGFAAIVEPARTATRTIRLSSRRR